MSKILDIFTSKFTFPFLIIIAVIVGWKYVDMKWTINEQEEEIQYYKEKNLILQVDLETEQFNIEQLKKTIESLNMSITKIELKNQKIEKNYTDFKKKTLEEKYHNAKVIDVLKSRADTCEEGLRINRIISGMKYEELE